MARTNVWAHSSTTRTRKAWGLVHETSRRRIFALLKGMVIRRIIILPWSGAPRPGSAVPTDLMPLFAQFRGCGEIRLESQAGPARLSHRRNPSHAHFQLRSMQGASALACSEKVSAVFSQLRSISASASCDTAQVISICKG